MGLSWLGAIARLLVAVIDPALLLVKVFISFGASRLGPSTLAFAASSGRHHGIGAQHPQKGIGTPPKLKGPAGAIPAAPPGPGGGPDLSALKKKDIAYPATT